VEFPRCGNSKEKAARPVRVSRLFLLGPPGLEPGTNGL